jgi:hypothetical protein
LEAATLYRASLRANGANFCAANELGVLLAQSGRLEEARGLLLHSVRVSPQRVTWHNLAAVHARLGETRLAEQARAQAEAMPQPRIVPSLPVVDWVDPAAFSRISSDADHGRGTPPLAQAPPHTVQPAAAQGDGATKKASTTWRPWNSRR